MARGRVPKKRKVEQASSPPEDNSQEIGSTTVFKQDPNTRNDDDQEEPPAVPFEDQSACLFHDEPLDGAVKKDPLDIYRQHLSPEAIDFIFSEDFAKGIMLNQNDATHQFGIPTEVAMTEFRRLLLMKVFAVDTDASKISPTPIMDVVWHAAILNTRFYADLQAALGVILHHSPTNASEDQADQRQKRLSTMKALYKIFFDTEPLGGDSSENWFMIKKFKPAMQIFCKTLKGSTVTRAIL